MEGSLGDTNKCLVSISTNDKVKENTAQDYSVKPTEVSIKKELTKESLNMELCKHSNTENSKTAKGPRETST